jgi:hypothetical protein
MRVAAVAAIAVGGVVLAVFPSCQTVLTTFNPCGTIFAWCEPGDVYTLFSEAVPDYYLDPTCTIPFQCDLTEPIWPHTPGPRPEPQ